MENNFDKHAIIFRNCVTLHITFCSPDCKLLTQKYNPKLLLVSFSFPQQMIKQILLYFCLDLCNSKRIHSILLRKQHPIDMCIMHP